MLGGIIGAGLVIVLFDWALIILSSLTGASLIVQNIQFAAYSPALVFIILLIVGIVLQAVQLTADRRGKRSSVT